MTRCEPGACFEFVAEKYTTWRYDLEASGTGTRVTESFQFESKGFQKFIYVTLLRRPQAITKGAARTLARIKAVLEG